MQTPAQESYYEVYLPIFILILILAIIFLLRFFHADVTNLHFWGNVLYGWYAITTCGLIIAAAVSANDSSNDAESVRFAAVIMSIILAIWTYAKFFSVFIHTQGGLMLEFLEALLWPLWPEKKEYPKPIEVPSGCIVLTSPYLDIHNDYIQLYLTKKNDSYFLTDDGATILKPI
ncbi:DUF1828 domain-containing protein [Bartonella sp. TP]|uniref:DUF1828 domain-containing protein n=1 Tax=Bartonella sp. TP TaxID=3057550 RepID=UPI0025AF57EA|nr:DUF1828 domain-containing protein [Bartonella sp. TP]WJW79988.1 DUF1828 domain-containing protein [Bartonella sp. TP]